MPGKTQWEQRCGGVEVVVWGRGGGGKGVGVGFGRKGGGGFVQRQVENRAGTR